MFVQSSKPLLNLCLVRVVLSYWLCNYAVARTIAIRLKSSLSLCCHSGCPVWRLNEVNLRHGLNIDWSNFSAFAKCCSKFPNVFLSDNRRV